MTTQPSKMPNEEQANGTGNAKAGKDTSKNAELLEAVALVNKEIDREYKRLQKIADEEQATPIIVEGETHAGYSCRLMVDPQLVARIALKYDYPLYLVLGLDHPDTMWDELAHIFGLCSVFEIDL
ncbi:hypothetical protein [Enterocloster clostridioformis]|uniref:hypothetical protein n=1 Tax=Enterocloster clostridioformis TaxID=1531 RepID=UPI0008E7368E|nr:hypothetical protein [Enterocloster clostridioformis]SFG86906.1 hypothetical protein SAMN05660211_04199 [Enterocloster clostridioformis]